VREISQNQQTELVLHSGGNGGGALAAARSIAASSLLPRMRSSMSYRLAHIEEAVVHYQHGSSRPLVILRWERASTG